MEHDEKILGCIAKDENISQRQLARLIDLSLGHTNLLLHELVNQGLLTIEKIKRNSMRYILTPQGIARNAKRTYSYIRNAVKHSLMLKNELEHIFDHYSAIGYTVYLDGEKDEIYQIVKQVTIDKKPAHVKWLKNTDDLPDLYDRAIVVLWQTEKEEVYKQHGIRYINLLDGFV